jgi:Asp-tRNA(Asn)/Glu-tRNA(Gln) amidotransferase C subunit
MAKREHYRSSLHHSDVEGGDMATTTLSTETIAEMVHKLGGLSLSPSELQGLAPQLETLFQDIQTLESIDLGEVEPETLFDIQGE